MTNDRISTKYNKTKSVDRQLQNIYTQENYHSKNGFSTNVWGPCKWMFLHTMSFNYPVKPTDTEKKKYRNYILSLRHILPCGKCRENLTKNLKKLPLTMEHMMSRDTFSKYIYDLHELINDMLGKKSGLTYDDVKARYESFRANCHTTKKRKTKKTKHSGCTEPLVGVKKKCVMEVVPFDEKTPTLTVDKKCIPTAIEEIENKSDK